VQEVLRLLRNAGNCSPNDTVTRQETRNFLSYIFQFSVMNPILVIDYLLGNSKNRLTIIILFV